MKHHRDLAQGLLQKAANDWGSAQLCQGGYFFDTACFHAQQAAEKYLKAFLASRDIEHLRTHDLEQLLGQCILLDKTFSEIEPEAGILTPYAINVRYETEFWPTQEETEIAIKSANKIREFVIAHLPTMLQP